MTKPLLFLALWVACGLGAAGMANAHFRADPHHWSTQVKADREAREQCGFSYGWGLMGGPVSFGVAYFATGFAYDGWSLDCGPVKEDHADAQIQCTAEQAKALGTDVYHCLPPAANRTEKTLDHRRLERARR